MNNPVFCANQLEDVVLYFDDTPVRIETPSLSYINRPEKGDCLNGIPMDDGKRRLMKDIKKQKFYISSKVSLEVSK